MPWVACNRCHFRCHIKCSGSSEEQIDDIESERWECAKCTNMKVTVASHLFLFCLLSDSLELCRLRDGQRRWRKCGHSEMLLHKCVKESPRLLRRHRSDLVQRRAESLTWLLMRLGRIMHRTRLAADGMIVVGSLVVELLIFYLHFRNRIRSFTASAALLLMAVTMLAAMFVTDGSIQNVLASHLRRYVLRRKPGCSGRRVQC